MIFDPRGHAARRSFFSFDREKRNRIPSGRSRGVDERGVRKKPRNAQGTLERLVSRTKKRTLRAVPSTPPTNRPFGASLEVLALRLVPHVGRARRGSPGARGTRTCARARGECRAACTRWIARPPRRRARRGRPRACARRRRGARRRLLVRRRWRFVRSRRGDDGVDDRTVSTKTSSLAARGEDKTAPRAPSREEATAPDATLFPDTPAGGASGSDAPSTRGARRTPRRHVLGTWPLRTPPSRARSRPRALRVSRSSAGWEGTHPRATTSSSSWRTPSRGRTRCFRRRRPCSPRRDPCARR